MNLLIFNALSWEQRKLGDLYTERNERGNGSLQILSVSIHTGVSDGELDVDNLGKFVRRSEDKSTYKHVHSGDLIFNMMRAWQGAIGVAKSEGMISPAYISAIPSEDIYPPFMNYLLRRKDVINQINNLSYGVTDFRKRLYWNSFVQVNCKLPSVEEQRNITDVFEKIDHLITLHQSKAESWKNKENQLSTISWEQRKLGEVATIERGGSPRPIDAYITDASDGLNWVKIGDAPEQGRYINHTEEKIKPSGLSKTRQVFPGDLILSNSMSFGKPYIMGIPGCIHDGWLLIRNSQNVFDLKFLCHMLGTDQMLKQYQSLAAGSTVNNLNKELVSNAVVSVPNKPEQERIGAFLESIDDVITLHHRKLNRTQICINRSFIYGSF